jgi:hypothetical protein
MSLLCAAILSVCAILRCDEWAKASLTRSMSFPERFGERSNPFGREKASNHAVDVDHDILRNVLGLGGRWSCVRAIPRSRARSSSHHIW